jgi:hypothetical protein
MNTEKFSQKTYKHLIIVVLLGLVVYSNTFSVPFHFDGIRFIKENPFIKDINYFYDDSKIGELAIRMNISPDIAQYFTTRKVGNLTLWANYKLDGLEVRGYHAVNLAIHIINAMLVYLIVRLTFRAPVLAGSRLKERSGLIALCSALLFVSHPMQTEAVNYILQRMVLLAAMFYFLSIAAYASARLSSGKLAKYGLFALAIVSAVLGMKTKENFFTLPAAIALYEFMFFKEGLGKRILYLIPVLSTMLIIPASYAKMKTFSCVFETQDRTWVEYLMTSFHVITSYIGLLLYPAGQNVDHHHTILSSFLDPMVFLSFLFLAGIIMCGVYMIIRSLKGEPVLRLAAFGIFWFFLALSVESSVFSMREIMVEYRAYLPSAGFLTAGMVLLFLVYDSPGTTRPLIDKAKLPMLAMLIIIMSMAAYQRNTVWASELTLWRDAAEKSPHKNRPQFNVARAYYSEGMLREAIDHFEAAIEIEPSDEEAHYSLAIAYNDIKMRNEAEIHYKEAIKLNPYSTKARFNLAIMYISQKRFAQAREGLEEILQLEPGHQRASRFLDYVNKEQHQ